MTTATPIQTAKTSRRARAGCGLWLDVLALALILALNWICYVRVINGYFLADDFLHVAYLKQVFDGDWMSLARNFWGNWMQAEGTTFYRPLISLSLALDYLFFGANAAGFHLSNLFFQTVSSLLLYLVASDIIRLFMAPAAGSAATAEATDDGLSAGTGEGKSGGNATSTFDGQADGQPMSEEGGQSAELQSAGAYSARLGGLATALLFSVSPLHCEVVAWIIARVDSVACLFYLASFSLYLYSLRRAQKASRRLLALSLFCFALSLCSKEMAVTLPPTVFLLLFLTAGAGNAQSLRQRFFGAFRKTLPFWTLLVIYLVLRTLALGTISGGYQGSIGEGLSNSLVKRWLQDGSFWRVLFPLNLDVFGHGHSLYKTLRLLYIVAAVNFTLALLTAKQKSPAIKSFVFGLGWLVLTLLPTYQVWNLTETLQGSRFIYFGTMPLAFLLALTVIPPALAPLKTLNRLLLPLRLLLLVFFVVAFATITSKNNQPWYHAMQELKAFQQAICRLAQTNAGDKLFILNIPQSYRGAHMLYNGATMSVMLRPPLAEKDIVDRIYTFEPATFGDADLIAVSRLRRLTATAGGRELYFWDREKLAIQPLDFDSAGDKLRKNPQLARLFNFTGNPASTTGTLLLGEAKTALSPPLDLPSSDIDAITVQMAPASMKKLQALKDSDTAKKAVLCLSYPGGQIGLPLIDADATGRLTFQLSEHKSWLKQGNLHEISFKTLGCAEPVEIVSIEALDLSSQSPIIEADGHDLVEGVDGICRVKGSHPTFSYDVSNVPGAQAATCEVSKPNSWFEHYSGTLRDTDASKNALAVIPFNKLKGRNIIVSFAGLKEHGFYQIKVAAVDKNGKIIGYFSDPLNFQL